MSHVTSSSTGQLNKMPQPLAEQKSRPVNSLSRIQRYGLGVISVALALGAALLVQYFNVRNVEVVFFLFALAITSWYGGGGPAVVALILSTFSFDYFFIEPLHTIFISSSDLPYFVTFTLFASLVTWFGTIRRRAEADLRQARDNLVVEVAERTRQASLLNLTHDTIFVRDLDDVITYWNRGAQELFGWTAEEAIGKKAPELLHTAFSRPVEEIKAELLRSERWDGEIERSKSDGSRVILSARWSLQRNDRGEPAAILETNNDITDRKKREEEIRTLNEDLEKQSKELQSINKELEAFAYSISHDLRAPLRHMVGFTELLQKNAGPSLNEKSQRYVTTVLDAAKKMGNLIDDLLAFSRIGRAEAHKTRVSLDQIVQEAVSEVKQETEGRNVSWAIDKLPTCYGDRSMLRLVLINLIANAAKFTRTRPNAKIEIGCKEQTRNRVVIFVRDNGVGFDMKYSNKLFGVFQRLHPTEAFEGTGIGLATVQRIIHRHGGVAWAEGAVDNGATFYFSLSASQGD